MRLNASTKFDTNLKTAAFAARHPSVANRVGKFESGSTNISSVASRIARHLAKGGDNFSIGEGTERNAFRHALWSAMITSEFGENMALRATNVHEGIAILNVGSVDFTKKFEDSNLMLADQTVDFLNNEIGRNIAKNNPYASTEGLTTLILSTFAKEGLWTISTDKDGNITISRSTISEDQHSKARWIMLGLDEHGFDEEERKRNKF